MELYFQWFNPGSPRFESEMDSIQFDDEVKDYKAAHRSERENFSLQSRNEEIRRRWSTGCKTIRERSIGRSEEVWTWIWSGRMGWNSERLADERDIFSWSQEKEEKGKDKKSKQRRKKARMRLGWRMNERLNGIRSDGWKRRMEDWKALERKRKPSRENSNGHNFTWIITSSFQSFDLPPLILNLFVSFSLPLFIA